MLNIEMIEAVILTAGFAISCFAFVLSLAQSHVSRTYIWLGVLFFGLILSDVSDVFALILIDPAPEVMSNLRMISFLGSFLIPPTLLMYARALTGLTLLRDTRAGLIHLILPAIAALISIGFLALPNEARVAIFLGGPMAQASTFETVIMLALFALSYAFYVQCLVYSIMAFVTEVKHREHLKNLFASTEPFEMRWITGMGLLFGSFAVLNLISLISGTFGLGFELSVLMDGFMELLINLTLAAWGLRQTPGIASFTPARTEHQIDQHIKYEKSALDTERAARISSKLNMAMERDQLFRDPNLSLMTLSKHVGVSTNYVSQSLNEHLGLSFFDFVNGWRVEASKPIILSGEQPITVIAYDVGFNSRSSFYTAFKKNTGLTPSKFSERSLSCAASSV